MKKGLVWLFALPLLAAGQQTTALSEKEKGWNGHLYRLQKQGSNDSLLLLTNGYMQQSPTATGLALLYNYKSWAWYTKTNYDSCTYYSHRLMAQAQQLGIDSLLVNANINLAAMECIQYRFNKAIELLRQAMQVAYRMGDSVLITKSLAETARVFYSWDNGTDSAKQYIEKALATGQCHQCQKVQAVAWYYGGMIYLSSGNYAMADTCLRKSLPVFMQHNNPLQAAMIKKLQAELYFETGRKREAYTLVTDMINNGKQQQNADILLAAYTDAVNFAERDGTYRQAFDYLLELNELKDSLHTDNNKEILATAKANVEKQLKEQENRLLAAEIGNKRKNLLLLYLLSGGLLLALLAGLFFFRRYRQQRAAKEAALINTLALKNQLQQMQNQLSPHFLQNIFNTLYIQVFQNTNSNQLKEYMHEVAAFFKELLVVVQQEQHTLAAELHFTEKYLQIQQLLCSGQWEYRMPKELPPRLAGLMVPTMLLQPLVENSIKYGFAQGTQSGSIVIDALLDKVLHITVTDNGSGLTDTAGEHATGVGLQNIAKRLSLLHGAGANISIGNHHPKGVKVTITIE
jgi:hypothetical protein